MNSERHDELFFQVLLGERPKSDLEELLRSDPSARAEWEELQRMWDDLGQVLEPPRPRLETAGARRIWIPAVLAACLAGFLFGTWYGAEPEVLGAGQDRFAFLLYAPAGGSGAPADPTFVQRVIAEQRAWSDQLELERRHILSEKLTTGPGVTLVRADGEIREVEEQNNSNPRLGGLYVIYADDLGEATRIARDCPLLKYGGTVRVRAIEKTQTGGVS